jgi:hypothetical protein
MRLADRIRRWWKPAQWRDEHPEESEGEDRTLSEEQRLGNNAAQQRYGDELAKGPSRRM